MKFSMTAAGQTKKHIDILRQQKVFNAMTGEVEYPKDETVVTLNLDRPGRQVSSHTPLEVLYHYVSDSKPKISWGLLVGVTTYESKLNSKKFEPLYEECMSRLQSGIRDIRWLDVLFLLLVKKLVSPREEIWDVADGTLKELVRLDGNIEKVILVFQHGRVSPTI